MRFALTPGMSAPIFASPTRHTIMTQTITMTSLPNDGQPARNLSETQRQAVRDVVELARQRAIAEVEIESAYRQEMDTILQTFEKRQQELQQTFDSRRVAIQQEYQQVRKEAIARFDAEYGALEAEYKQTRDDFVLQYEAEREALDHAAQEGSWEATTLFDADRIRIEERHKETIKVTTEALEQIDVLQKQAKVLLQDWVDENRVPVKRRRKTEEAHLERLQQTVQDAAAHLEQLEGLTIPRLLKGEKIVWLFVLFWLVACAVFAFVMKLLLVLDAVEVNAAGWPKHWYIWFGIMTVTIGFACTITRFWLAAVGRQQIDAIYPSFCGALAEARALCKRCQEEDADSYQRLKKEYSDRHQKELARIKQQHQQKRAALERRYQQDVHDTDRDYRQRLADMKEAHDANLARIDEHYRRLMADALREFKAASQQAETDKQTATAKSQNRYEQAWKELIQRWTEGQKKLQGVARKVNTLGHKLFPSWSEVDWDQWHPPVDLPPGIRFGQFTFDLSKISHGVSADPRLPLLEPYRFDLPALLPFPHQSSLLLRAEGAGRDKAVQTLRAVMLRFLTTLPPGKVRFTIIDPVGLGENFAAFMHLADYNDALVTNRIWTEPTHIEQRLADLTEHMETVIQKYLRNQFRTIADYNRIAGEVAEPYRVLVVANFPANFTELAARRLLSIAASGSSCGVFTLISTDGKLPLPQDFDIRDIEQNSVTLIWNGEQFNWKDNDFGQCPLELEQPPGDHTCLQIMHTVGAKAKEASRVEVPFEVIAPPDDRWWSSDSRGGIKVPLGKAGATKLQNLELGQGTSQHVLVAGKTGSGKSTLLHALITNLALHYSPDEVEVYLIDFKKGVEFKTYAVHQLPHARVVAIESEREFGLSVLQRLDAELKARGELFRSMRVQDIHAYRNANPDAVMPRILLIVDEFQEFFVEDDKIAQDVALLLDRLVRQGRAFGIHVLLGSQTLSGAYSLARSTIGQMAVRIALQCSEADAGVILSEDNTAARLLSRPGEAIYNDANGMMEGNDFFPGRLARRRTARTLPPTHSRTSRAKANPTTHHDRFRRQCPCRCPQQRPAARNIDIGAPQRTALTKRPGLARRSDCHQGADSRRLPPPNRFKPPFGRPTGRSRFVDHGDFHAEHRRTTFSQRSASVLRSGWHADRSPARRLPSSRAGKNASRVPPSASG
ncbi:MAG: hypothetical protein KatS3mg105_4606 [Gemmatales bacterium]|nr:MAG: hypothetical protein KatS3mg105_4606 [Gemmatales bacterium]